MKERRYVEKVLAGNSSAFAYFVNNYQGMGINIAYQICNNMQDAEDIVQESFVKAYKNLHTFRLDSKFSTWFYRIVFNTAVSHSRAKVWIIDDEVESTTAGLASDINITTQLEMNERSEVVTHIIENMPKAYGLILKLFYLEEHSIKEVAEITSLNNSNVKVMLHRARKMFKERMTKSYPELYKERKE